MEIKRYDSLPQEAKDIREKVFVEEQGFKRGIRRRGRSFRAFGGV